MMNNEEMRRYDYIVENGVATTDELNLAYNLTTCGWCETIDKVVYIRTGYNDFNQWVDAEKDDEII